MPVALFGKRGAHLPSSRFAQRGSEAAIAGGVGDGGEALRGGHFQGPRQGGNLADSGDGPQVLLTGLQEGMLLESADDAAVHLAKVENLAAVELQQRLQVLADPSVLLQQIPEIAVA